MADTNSSFCITFSMIITASISWTYLDLNEKNMYLNCSLVFLRAFCSIYKKICIFLQLKSSIICGSELAGKGLFAENTKKDF